MDILCYTSADSVMLTSNSGYGCSPVQCHTSLSLVESMYNVNNVLSVLVLNLIIRLIHFMREPKTIDSNCLNKINF